MGLWARLFAFGYDRAMRATEDGGLADRRRELLAQAQGRVLEIGAGTGANLVHYPEGLSQLTLTEPEGPMARRLTNKLAESGRDATVKIARAERLPFEDGSFDTVVATLVFCTVDSMDAALKEVKRVLAPGGKLLFLEHVRSTDRKASRRQDRFHGIWRVVGHGCHCNRDTVAAFGVAGLDVLDLEQARMPKAVSIVKPLVIGSARVSG